MRTEAAMNLSESVYLGDNPFHCVTEVLKGGNFVALELQFAGIEKKWRENSRK